VRRAFRAGAIAVALGVAGLGGRASAGESRELPVDISGEVGADAIALLGQQVGPIFFHEVLVQARPTAEEIREANPGEESHPKMLLILDSSSRKGCVLDLQLQLQDEAGRMLAACAGVVVQPSAWKDVVEVCRRPPDMATLDWPKVKTFRLVGTVKVRS